MNRRISLLLILPLLLVVFLPINANAQTVTERASEVCNQMIARRNVSAEKFNEQLSKFTSRVEVFTSSAESRRAEVDEALALSHQKFDNKHQAWYENFKSEHQDEVDIAAVDEFYETLQSIIETRRSAYQQARLDYRKALDDLRVSRQAAVISRAETYRQTADTVFQTAQDACGQRGTTLINVRSEFVAGLRQARLAFSDFRREQPSYKAEVVSLTKQRDEATDEASKVFQQAFQQAYSDFKSKID